MLCINTRLYRSHGCHRPHRRHRHHRGYRSHGRHRPCGCAGCDGRHLPDFRGGHALDLCGHRPDFGKFPVPSAGQRGYCHQPARHLPGFLPQHCVHGDGCFHPRHPYGEPGAQWRHAAGRLGHPHLRLVRGGPYPVLYRALPGGHHPLHLGSRARTGGVPLRQQFPDCGAAGGCSHRLSHTQGRASALPVHVPENHRKGVLF